MPVNPALDFSPASSRAATATQATLPTTTTTIAWIYLTTTGGGTPQDIVGSIAAPSQGYILMNHNLSDAFEIFWNRATTNLSVTAAAANFRYWAVNKWVCIVAFMDSTGANTDQRLMIGDIYNFPVEPSSYGTQVVGSGAVSFTNQPIIIGAGSSTGNNPTQGRISAVGMWKRLLNAQQVQRYRFDLLKRKPSASGAYTFWPRIGVGGQGTVIDFSGSGINATVTNATATAGILHNVWG